MANNPLGPQALMAEAKSRTGFEDFGDEAFGEPLAVICRSLATEAPLSPEGRVAQRERLIGRLADRLILHEWLRRYPEIAQEDIGVPVVIAGLPRTGTTMLYRMLSAAEGLTPPLFYEVTQLAPAFDWDFEAQSDPRIAKAHLAVEAMMAAMPELASIYPFEALAPEESIYLYGASLVSTSEQSSALVASYNAWFRTADKRPAYRYLRLSLQFLQWQRRRSGRHQDGARWLLKTPDHLHGLEALLEVFPGAHIIQTHRDPVQTIPSICSFIRVLHSGSTARDDSVDIGQAWTAMFAASMTKAMQIRAENPQRFLDVWYRDTVADPRKVAEAVFAFIGQPLTEAGWTEMQKWRDANRREERPTHTYTLEEFGLSEAQIKADFKAYRKQFIEPPVMSN
jgi:hypothetical protein